MKNAGGPLAMSFPQLPARPTRVRPGGALDPTARGIVITDLPDSIESITVGGMEVTPDADGFIPIGTSQVTPVVLTKAGVRWRLFVRLLQPAPRVVPFEEIPYVQTDPLEGEFTQGFGRLELVGVPITARVEVGEANENFPGREALVPVDSKSGGPTSRWNADRTIRTILIPAGYPRTVQVTTGDGRTHKIDRLSLEAGEVRDVILSHLRIPSIPPSTTAPPGPSVTPPVGTPGQSNPPDVTAPLGSALLVLSVRPVGAVVSVNGTAIRDASRPVTLPPGPYRLDVSAQGYEKHTETFVATADRTIRLAVNLTPVPVKKGWTRGQIALAAVGGVAVLGGLGAVVVYLARRPAAPAPAPSLPAAGAPQALPPDGRSNPRRGAAREEEPADDEADESERRPSQEDIDESIHVVQRSNLRFTRSRMVRGEATEQDYTADGWVAYYERREIARAPSRATLFKKLDALALSLGSPSIVSVNDHGNVTTYSYTGKVLNEWV